MVKHELENPKFSANIPHFCNQPVLIHFFPFSFSLLSTGTCVQIVIYGVMASSLGAGLNSLVSGRAWTC